VEIGILPFDGIQDFKAIYQNYLKVYYQKTNIDIKPKLFITSPGYYLYTLGHYIKLLKYLEKPRFVILTTIKRKSKKPVLYANYLMCNGVNTISPDLRVVSELLDLKTVNITDLKKVPIDMYTFYNCLLEFYKDNIQITIINISDYCDANFVIKLFDYFKISGLTVGMFNYLSDIRGYSTKKQVDQTSIRNMSQKNLIGIMKDKNMSARRLICTFLSTYQGLNEIKVKPILYTNSNDYNPDFEKSNGFASFLIYQ